ncbi:hypothetical protein HYS91_04080 [Candidatus Daviesbacteria bacterium]|nr:hypothetical protein [Candidatus Daviesbacteria bacterium]
MGDGAKGAIKGVMKDLGEAVVKPVANEASTIINETIQSISGGGSTQNPQDEHKKKEEEQKLKVEEANKKRNIEMFLRQLQEQEQKLKATRQKEAQEKQAKEQEEQQKKQVKQFKVFEQQKKKQDINLATKQRKTEIKRGSA